MRSIVGVPIVVQGEIVATLTVARLSVRPFDAEDQRALAGLAGHAAVALRNARLLDLSRRLESLSREVALETGALDDVMRRVANDIAAAYDAELVTISLISGELSRGIAHVGIDEPTPSRLQKPGPLTRLVMQRREAVLVRDYQREMGNDPQMNAAIARKGVHASVGAPVIVNGDVVASVMVGTTDPHRSFDAIDRQGLTAFAQVTGVALRSAQTRDERERRIHRLSALNVLAWQLAAVHEPYEIGRLAYEAAGTLVVRDAFYVAPADRVRIW